MTDLDKRIEEENKQMIEQLRQDMISYIWQPVRAQESEDEDHDVMSVCIPGTEEWIPVEDAEAHPDYYSTEYGEMEPGVKMAAWILFYPKTNSSIMTSWLQQRFACTAGVHWAIRNAASLEVMWARLVELAEGASPDWPYWVYKRIATPAEGYKLVHHLLTYLKTSEHQDDKKIMEFVDMFLSIYADKEPRISDREAQLFFAESAEYWAQRGYDQLHKGAPMTTVADCIWRGLDGLVHSLKTAPKIWPGGVVGIVHGLNEKTWDHGWPVLNKYLHDQVNPFARSYLHTKRGE